MPFILLLTSSTLAIMFGFASLSGSFEHGPQADLNLFGKVLFFSVISMPFGLGEELGWRGYAQNKLVRRHGLLKGLFILGLVWGAWHSPAFYCFDLFPKNPILGPFVMTPIDNLLAVAPLAWLYVRSKNMGSVHCPCMWRCDGRIVRSIDREKLRNGRLGSYRVPTARTFNFLFH